MEPSDTGTVMGHKAIGVVEAVGADVRTIKANDFIVMPFAWSDGTCEFCREGLQTSCLHGGFFGNVEAPEHRPKPSVSRWLTERFSSSRSAKTTR